MRATRRHAKSGTNRILHIPHEKAIYIEANPICNRREKLIAPLALEVTLWRFFDMATGSGSILTCARS